MVRKARPQLSIHSVTTRNTVVRTGSYLIRNLPQGPFYPRKILKKKIKKVLRMKTTQ